MQIRLSNIDIRFVSSDDQNLPCVVGLDKDKTPTHLQNELKEIASHDIKSIWINNRLVSLVSFKQEPLEEIGANIYKTVQSLAQEVMVLMHQDPKETAQLASGAYLRSWEFDIYKTEIDDKKPKIKTITFVTKDPQEAQKYFESHKAINDGNILTRHVVSEPPNVLFPESFAEHAKSLENLGLEVEVLGEAKMRELGFGALLGVGQGSARQSQLVVMRWKGNDKDPVAIVGKGVTFDSGGISIKPSNHMEDMKYDMAGAGVVLGLMKTLALTKAPVHVVGVMGLAENMPSGTAQRPADVVKSLSGQTIEVVNTDAEGRLVLADALWYVQQHYKPRTIVDLATLTGAVVVALGEDHAGLMSNNDELSSQLLSAGKETNERLWRLPLSKRKEGYDKDVDSDIADMKNVGSGRGAGTVTAAQFLQRFIQNDTPWAHLDIAGVAWEKKSHPLTGKGATGFGVRLLNTWLKNYYS